MQESKLHAVAKLGQSIWLDFIRRSLLTSGGLQEYVDKGVSGITSNPAIFEKAITAGSEYDEDLRRLAAQGMSAMEIYEALAIADIQRAADILRPVFDAEGEAGTLLAPGDDGYVSLEVSPALAHDAQGTIAEARRLNGAVDRPNVMIKVPATSEGLVAIERLTAEGLNINVTLMFSLLQYDQVAAAYLRGLEARAELGKSLSDIASVASFFVSRIDVKIDRRLDAIGTPEAAALRGKIGIASAKMAYQRFRATFRGERWARLANRGASVQRVLFGSTGTKDPAYPDTLYVDNLIAPETVNTLPPDTIEAFLDHGTAAVTLETDLAAALSQLEALDQVGIDLSVATRELLDEGIEKFATPFDSLLDAIEAKRATVAI